MTSLTDFLNLTLPFTPQNVTPKLRHSTYPQNLRYSGSSLDSKSALYYYLEDRNTITIETRNIGMN